MNEIYLKDLTFDAIMEGCTEAIQRGISRFRRNAIDWVEIDPFVWNEGDVEMDYDYYQQIIVMTKGFGDFTVYYNSFIGFWVHAVLDIEDREKEIEYWKDQLFECRLEGNEELRKQCIESLRELGVEI